MLNLQIEPQEVKQKMERGDGVVLVDVREPWEQSKCRIEGAVLAPMKDLPAHLGAIENADEVVVFCHLGIRSINAAAWLREQGIEHAQSMSGGIDRWAKEIDPTVPRY